MTTPEQQRPETFSTEVPPLMASWLDQQRRLDSSDVRLRVTGMVQRSARNVFGTSLENETVNTFRLIPRANDLAVGSRVIHLGYAPSVGAAMRAVRWDEGSSQLDLYCASLYGRIIQDMMKPPKIGFRKSAGDFDSPDLGHLVSQMP